MGNNIKKLLLIIVISNFIFASESEKDSTESSNFFINYWNSLVHDSHDVSEPQFLAYPTLAFTPETSWEIGVSNLYIYYANQDTTNRLSEIAGFTFYTLENQFGAWFDHALYSDKDKWFFLGRIRTQSFPLLYWGIGMDTPDEQLGYLETRQITIRERILHKVRKNFFIGLELDFQFLDDVTHNIDDVELPTGVSEQQFKDDVRSFTRGIDGSTNFGWGLGIVYDNRHNVLNVRDGFFSELAILHYDKNVFSEFDFTLFSMDTRYFTPFNRTNVFAAQVISQFNVGHVPFNQLALMGGESIMRGYYLGRYRDHNQIATQMELRFLPIDLGFSKRFGATVFGSSGSVFNESINDVVFDGGAGLRFLIFPKKDVFVRFDVAYTSDGDLGYYLWLGEAF